MIVVLVVVVLALIVAAVFLIRHLQNSKSQSTDPQFGETHVTMQPDESLDAPLK